MKFKRSVSILLAICLAISVWQTNVLATNSCISTSEQNIDDIIPQTLSANANCLMSETNSLKLTDKDKVQIFGSSDDVVEKIISDKPFSIDGYIKVNADNMTYELNDYYDFANVMQMSINMQLPNGHITPN